jgi:peptidase E
MECDMKRLVFLITSILICAQGAYSNDTLTNGGNTILFVYEEANEQIDPWVELFKKTFTGQNRSVEYVASADVTKKNIASFSSVVIYGAVQAFTFKGPVREWLKTDINLAGKKVYLIVTASRWFATDYFKQLKKELTKKNAETVNAVSAATAKMTDTEKATFVNNFVQNIP